MLDSESSLKIYKNHLLKWQKKINLISPQTIKDSDKRHFEDSAQLCRFIPNGTKALYDLGSGAGFPGLVIGLMRPDIDVTLIESDQRKCSFLKTVSRETKAENITVCNQRIEEAVYNLSPPHIITARALASLDKLCDYAIPWATKNPALALLLLKGERVEQEIEEAQKNHHFDYDLYKSTTDQAAQIIGIKNLSIS